MTKSMKVFTKGGEAPCVRFLLCDERILVLPYMTLSNIEMGISEELITATFGGLMIQIEGSNLESVLDELQKFGVHTLAAGEGEKEAAVIKRIVAVPIRDESE